MGAKDSNGTGIGAGATKQCRLRYLYLNDVSFEAPHVPGILFGHKQPVLEFDITNDYTLSADRSSTLGEIYAVNVQVTVKSTDEDKTLFLIEARQGGLFEVVGYTGQELDFLLRTKAVETLFPYLRELVTSLVARAGFPNVRLRPVNFEGRYSEALEKHIDAVRKAPGKGPDQQSGS